MHIKLPLQLLNHLIFIFLSPIYFKFHMTSSGHAWRHAITACDSALCSLRWSRV